MIIIKKTIIYTMNQNANKERKTMKIKGPVWKVGASLNYSFANLGISSYDEKKNWFFIE